MQPSAGLSWIRQCSQCRDFDADDLQEQIAAAEQRGAIKALRDAAESVDLIDHMFANLRVNQPRAVRETSKYLHNRADQMEGDDEKH